MSFTVWWLNRSWHLKGIKCDYHLCSLMVKMYMENNANCLLKTMNNMDANQQHIQKAVCVKNCICSTCLYSFWLSISLLQVNSYSKMDEHWTIHSCTTFRLIYKVGIRLITNQLFSQYEIWMEHYSAKRCTSNFLAEGSQFGTNIFWYLLCLECSGTLLIEGLILKTLKHLQH